MKLLKGKGRRKNLKTEKITIREIITLVPDLRAEMTKPRRQNIIFKMVKEGNS